jgi:hypothetical protein
MTKNAGKAAKKRRTANLRRALRTHRAGLRIIIEGAAGFAEAGRADGCEDPRY